MMTKIFEEKVAYKTERLKFKMFGPEDMTPDYFSWFYDPEVTAHNSHGLFPYSEKQKEDFLYSIENGDRIVWAVYTHNNIHIGNVDLTSFSWINRSCELAIVIGNKFYWGEGYGYEMCQVAIDHAFDKLNMNRVWTGTSQTNLGMIKLAEKCGMSFEGKFREGKFLNGMFVDIVMYSLLKWENRPWK